MKIVIVGGGTAGWLTALYMCRFNSRGTNEIVVMESSNIPIIGAGEGSTGVLTRIINNDFSMFGINEVDFLNNTDATVKLGINLKDWSGVGTQFYSPLESSNTTASNVDYDLLVSMCSGEYYNSSRSGHLMASQYAPFASNKKDKTSGYGYHFDAHKVGQYFKSKAIKFGVKFIDTEITGVNRNSETGDLESVDTTNGNIKSDFWVDCSGFNRVLIGPMGGGWKSYKEHLPINAAIPYIHQYQKDEYPNLETLAWAQKNGWMWQIPTQERYGCGYAYSDMFTTYDKAVDELRKTTGRDIEPLRNLKFDCGRLEKFWINNVVAVGLSAGFVEPLEATSIHTTIIQLDLLLNNNLNFIVDKKDIIYKSNVESYNSYFSNMFDDVRDLIQSHYITNREDTEFWKYCKYEMKKTDKVLEILDISKHRSPSRMDFQIYHGGIGWGVWCWTLIGLDNIDKGIAKKTLESFGYNETEIANAYRSISHKNLLNRIKSMTKEEFFRALKNKNLVEST